MESIESLAKSFDRELKQLELLSSSSSLHKDEFRFKKTLDIDLYAEDRLLPEHSFELAAAESEREKLYDKMHDLAARVEELEMHNRHQDGMIAHLKKRNRSLEEKLLVAESNRNRFDETDSEPSPLEIENDKQQELYRLKCKALEIKLREMKLLLHQSQKNAQDAATARQSCELARQEELAKRVHAEKQRDAYAAAYRQALGHIEKWSTSPAKG